MFTRNEKNGICYYTSTLLESYGITHGFFTRHGGVSCGDFSSLNVSTARRSREGVCDDASNVLKNYALALSALGTYPEKAVAATQIHGNTVLSVSSDDGGRGIIAALPQMSGADSLFLDKNTREIDAVCVKTADCVPVLLSSKDAGQVCAVHAGWRGTVGDIVTVAAEKFDCDKSNILCAIGPCTGECCYEVGDEVFEAVRKLFAAKGIEKLTDSMFSDSPSCSDGTRKKANLAKINKTLLINLGIPEQNIDLAEICTCCNESEFFSHRKSGGFSGTFLSAIKRSDI